ncbi:hypothetical protein PCANC_01448 [Puccinia coronata f. sp. avenae]|uniref:HAT C-terminal dimerisation domain-containing protein n=1 Tax=Puccinia coronata f. sp. avenae TaxID=200324 RepID=A0A2N5W2U6_9BASI|nr:hypothetical protein PCANC_01448 [Puccinia coronata f. sp. avenae]
MIRSVYGGNIENDNDNGNDNGSIVNDSLLAAELIDEDEVELEDDDKDQRHGLSRDYYINKDDVQLALDLVEILHTFYKITQQVSARGAAQIADIVVFIDQITCHLSTAISDNEDQYPTALRNACRAGLQLTNKYYTLTNCSPLYRVAMDEYFKLAKWKPEWIQESIRLTRKMWEMHYKPSPEANNSQPPNPRPKQPRAGVLAGLAEASEARGGSTLTNPIAMWLAGGLSLNIDGGPVNPLKWWMQQQRAGNTHGVLLQMAMDVLSCPVAVTSAKMASYTRGYLQQVPGYPPSATSAGAGTGAGIENLMFFKAGTCTCGGYPGIE